MSRTAIVVGLLVGLLVGTLTWVMISESDKNDRFNRWAFLCRERSGMPVVTHVDYWGGPWYECFVNNEIVHIDLPD